MNILIVDDEEEFVNFLKERLVGLGHQVDTAFDGAEALELLKTDKYGIVFADHNMPELTGLEIAKYARDNNMRAKVVIITAYEQMSAVFAKAVGADEYLTKPVSMRQIDDILNKYK